MGLLSNELETKEKLLKAAKVEFLELGYQKASLRNISKKAGVTTGALYFFFENKGDLFANLVSRVAEDIKAFVINHIEKEKELHHRTALSSTDHIPDELALGRELVGYMYANKEELMLLLSKSQGSSYENFFDEIVELMEDYSKQFVRELYGDRLGNLNDYTVHWISHLEVFSYAQLLLHGLSQEEALQQSDNIAKYLSGGWTGIFDNLKPL